MLKSEAEHAVRRALEDHNAEFTEEQILALSQMILKISNTVTEEILSTWRPSGSNRP
ncbi:MAG: hypothetical protein IPG59_11990 [Candidatus Melainabacteria bacterium]|nr:MAG: hypothetical protein IPG59_11990 [Candidatus Melainabacteria bacterium]